MGRIRIIQSGMLSSVQDLGRPGARHIGVPSGGAFDRNAHLLGNMLLGNDPSDASVEMTLIGAEFGFETDTWICLSGARAPSATLTVNHEQTTMHHQRVIAAPAGSTLIVGPLHAGARAYLCIAGGIRTPPLLDSRSALVSLPESGLGRALREGDSLPICAHTASAPHSVEIHAAPKADRPFRVVESHHTHLFEPCQRTALTGRTHRIAPQSNRSGLRLLGTGMPDPVPGRIRSVPTLPGYIQIPPDGSPIVLGVDAPTSGGYPVIASVIEQDLPRLAQLAPNDPIRFQWIHREDAQALAYNTEESR